VVVPNAQKPLKSLKKLPREIIKSSVKRKQTRKVMMNHFIGVYEHPSCGDQPKKLVHSGSIPHRRKRG